MYKPCSQLCFVITWLDSDGLLFVAVVAGKKPMVQKISNEQYSDYNNIIHIPPLIPSDSVLRNA
jgi:hypothetical protein